MIGFWFQYILVVMSHPQCPGSWLWLWMNWELCKLMVITQTWNYILEKPGEERRKGEAQPSNRCVSGSQLLRQRATENWGLMLAMNSISKLARKTEERGDWQEERGEMEPWPGVAPKHGIVIIPSTSMSGVPCITCTSYPSDSPFQPESPLKEDLV